MQTQTNTYAHVQNTVERHMCISFLIYYKYHIVFKSIYLLFVISVRISKEEKNALYFISLNLLTISGYRLVLMILANAYKILCYSGGYFYL